MLFKNKTYQTNVYMQTIIKMHQKGVLLDTAWDVMNDVNKWSLIKRKICEGRREMGDFFSKACLWYNFECLSFTV
jgi:hypothetical protein